MRFPSPSRDYVRSIERLAFGKPVVGLDTPSWLTELLVLLAALEFIALLMAVGETSIARTRAMNALEISEYWMEMATAPDSQPTVRLVSEGTGYRCSTVNVRREWERAVGAKCDELGGLLMQARTGH